MRARWSLSHSELTTAHLDRMNGKLAEATSWTKEFGSKLFHFARRHAKVVEIVVRFGFGFKYERVSSVDGNQKSKRKTKEIILVLNEFDSLTRLPTDWINRFYYSNELFGLQQLEKLERKLSHAHLLRARLLRNGSLRVVPWIYNYARIQCFEVNN